MTSIKLKELMKLLPALIVAVAFAGLMMPGQALATVAPPAGPCLGGLAPASADTTKNANCIPTASDPALAGGDSSATLITKYVVPFVSMLTLLVGVAVAIGIIYGGIEYSMSAGDPQKAAKGRKHILDAVIALVSYALIFAFLNFIIPGGVNV